MKDFTDVEVNQNKSIANTQKGSFNLIEAQ